MPEALHPATSASLEETEQTPNPLKTKAKEAGPNLAEPQRTNQYIKATQSFDAFIFLTFQTFGLVWCLLGVCWYGVCFSFLGLALAKAEGGSASGLPLATRAATAHAVMSLPPRAPARASTPPQWHIADSWLGNPAEPLSTPRKQALLT